MIASTIALPKYMGVRRGTAERLERIMPLEYSLEITKTPSTPKMSARNGEANVETVSR